MIKVKYKDPDAILDYVVDWSGVFPDDDPIVSATWDIPEALTEVSSAFLMPHHRIVVSGGEIGTEYTLTSRVTTSSGLQDDRSFLLRVLHT